MKLRSDRRSRLIGLGQVGLLPPAAFAVHQLRYLLAFGGHAGLELQRTGHSYLHSLVPWLALAAALAVGIFLRALGRAFAGAATPGRYTASLAVLWVACSASLLAIFVCQETLEGLFLTGHPAGLAGIFGYGGWWAIPVSAMIGLVLAAVMHGALWVLHEVARRRASSRINARRSTARARRPGIAPLLLAPEPLLSGWSDRGPPALS
jgi:hypothetical protein